MAGRITHTAPAVFGLAIAGLAAAPSSTPPVWGPSEDGTWTTPDGESVFYACYGVGSPVIILEAGTDSGGSEQYGRALLEPLAERTMTCVYDRLGTGASDAPVDSSRTLDDTRAVLEGLLAATGWPAPYLLVGQSGGGNLQIDFAAHHPDEVAGLVLIEAYHDDPEMMAAWQEEEGFEWTDNSEHLDWYEGSVRLDELALPLGDFPVLVMTATDADEGNVENQAFWLGISRDSEQVVVEGSHDLHEDDPGRVTDLILGMLDRLGASPSNAHDAEVATTDAGAAQQASSAPDDEDRTYETVDFVVPFMITVPSWLPAAATIDWPQFVTWDPATETDPAVRFLVPLNVYPPGATDTAPVPEDYLAYLLDQADHGATFTDMSETSVGGWPATLVTATVDQSLDGSLGCQEEGLAPDDCFGLQPEFTLRIAVIDAEDTTVLAWLRHNNSGTGDTATEFSEFEQMLRTVEFLDPSIHSTASTSPGVVSPIDGVWTTTITLEELASSPLLYDQGEVNDENWGEFTLTFDRGRFVGTQDGDSTTPISGTFEVDDDTVRLILENAEIFVMRWSIEGDVLTFERDESLGIVPTPFVIKPWTRQS